MGPLSLLLLLAFPRMGPLGPDAVSRTEGFRVPHLLRTQVRYVCHGRSQIGAWVYQPLRQGAQLKPQLARLRTLRKECEDAAA